MGAHLRPDFGGQSQVVSNDWRLMNEAAAVTEPDPPLFSRADWIRFGMDDFPSLSLSFFHFDSIRRAGEIPLRVVGDRRPRGRARNPGGQTIMSWRSAEAARA